MKETVTIFRRKNLLITYGFKKDIAYARSYILWVFIYAPFKETLVCFNSEIVEKLYKNDNLEQVVCIESDGFTNLEKLQVHQFAGSILAKLSSVVIRVLNFLKINYNKRLISEIFFDLFAVLKVKNASKITLFKIHYTFLTRRLFRKVIWVTFLVVFPSRFLKNIILRDAKRWNQNENSYYTIEKVVRNHEYILKDAQGLISLSSSQSVKSILKQHNQSLYEKIQFPENEFGVDQSVFKSIIKLLITIQLPSKYYHCLINHSKKVAYIC